MKPLTWAALKERIEKMTEQELQQPVRVWGEDMPIKNAFWDKADEDMYFHDDFDYCYPESELEDYTPEECILMAKKGTYYLYIE